MPNIIWFAVFLCHVWQEIEFETLDCSLDRTSQLITGLLIKKIIVRLIDYENNH